MWINHFDLLPGDSTVLTSYYETSPSPLGGGALGGVVIKSTTLGDRGAGGSNKDVHMGLQVPPGYLIKGVRVCYELSAKSFITQIRLSQVNDPPSSATVLLDDGTDRTAAGPISVDSTKCSVDPSRGAVLLSLRVNFSDLSDWIVVRALGLYLE